MSQRPARLRTVLAWLLTPVAAWAGSFLGAWLAAGVSGELTALVVGGVLGAGLGAWGWLLLLYRLVAVPSSPSTDQTEPS